MVFNQSERVFYLSYFNKIKYTIESLVYCSHTAISRKVVGKIACGNPIGIVGGFDFIVLERNLKEWYERPWRCVCEC